MPKECIYDGFSNHLLGTLATIVARSNMEDSFSSPESSETIEFTKGYHLNILDRSFIFFKYFNMV